METNNRSSTYCRRVARGVGAVAVAMILIVAVGERVPIARVASNFASHPLTAESLGLVGLVCVVVGLLVGWRWEIAGGVLSLVGVCALVEPTVHYGEITWFFAFLAAPGILYLVAQILDVGASENSIAQPKNPLGPWIEAVVEEGGSPFRSETRTHDSRSPFDPREDSRLEDHVGSDRGNQGKG